MYKSSVINTIEYHDEVKKIDSALITVIVPVYNVEPYLRKCLDSVLSQTYKYLEIFLVDDGSTDTCPQICDEYATKDKRIHVIHKKNGGLSSARNSGIDNANGQYITFVDSDDCIDKDMVSFLYNNLVKFNCDISTCGFTYVHENYTRRVKIKDSQTFVLNSNDALIDVLYNKHSSLHVCGKLFKTSLYSGIRFPEGKVYEDAGTTYKLVGKSKKVCISTSRQYNYLLRQNSITGSPFTRNTLDSLHFAQEIASYVKDYYPSAIKAAECYLFSTAVTMIYLILSSKQQNTYSDAISVSKAIILSYSKGVSSSNKADRRLRFYAYAARLNIYVLYTTLLTQNYFKKTYIYMTIHYSNVLGKTA